MQKLSLAGDAEHARHDVVRAGESSFNGNDRTE
jgi:hypothetical protein